MSAQFESKAAEYFQARAQLAANCEILGAVGERLRNSPLGGAPVFPEPSPFAGLDLLVVADECLKAAGRAREAMKAAAVVMMPTERRNGQLESVRPVGETKAEGEV